jgi:hypothetical protein
MHQTEDNYSMAYIPATVFSFDLKYIHYLVPIGLLREVLT